MGAIQEVFVPDIGDFKDVEIVEVLVKAGDRVAPEQSLITVESDKATMEIPSPVAGVVKELRVKVGDRVSEGSAILVLEHAEDSAEAPVPVSAAAPASTPAGATGGGFREVTVPDIGDFRDVEVVEVLVKPGDAVAAEQSLITVESDKATMEIPSPAAGVVKELRVTVGEKVSEGSPVLVLQEAAMAGTVPAAAAKAVPTPAPAAEPAAAAAASRQPPVRAEPAAEAAGYKPHASPSVRKFARELGVDLSRVRGSGPKGRVLQQDVQAFVKGIVTGAAPAPAAAGPAGGGAGLALPPWPQVDFAKFGPIETQPLSRIKKISGANLARNWVMIPHVTNNEEADITELEAFRVQLNREIAAGDGKGSPGSAGAAIKVTMLAFLIKAVVAALKKHPEFNASLDGDNLVLKRYYNIGFAADTPNGLVVPVIRDADQKGVFDLARETAELAKQAREGKLKPADMQGGCFSISSLGGIGGTHFTPIINAPEVAILGVSKSQMKPMWDGKAFQPRLMLPLSLSYDHRVIDGAAAARFNAFVAALLADFRRAML